MTNDNTEQSDLKSARQKREYQSRMLIMIVMIAFMGGAFWTMVSAIDPAAAQREWGMIGWLIDWWRT